MRDEELKNKSEAPEEAAGEEMQEETGAPEEVKAQEGPEPGGEEGQTRTEEETAPQSQAEKKAKPDKKAKGEKPLEALKAQLDSAEKDAAELKDKLLRTAAEYENFRKRSAREQDAAFNNGLSWAVEQLLPILDTLEMAAAAPCTDENYKKGVEMTLTKAAAALATLKVEEIEAQGKPFDPNLMCAVQQAPAGEGQESGTVARVYQKGYKIGDKVIRHAAVVVAE